MLQNGMQLFFDILVKTGWVFAVAVSWQLVLQKITVVFVLHYRKEWWEQALFHGSSWGDDQTPVIPFTRLLQEKQCPSMQRFSTVLEINSVVHASADVNRKVRLVGLIQKIPWTRPGNVAALHRIPPVTCTNKAWFCVNILVSIIVSQRFLPVQVQVQVEILNISTLEGDFQFQWP